MLYSRNHLGFVFILIHIQNSNLNIFFLQINCFIFRDWNKHQSYSGMAMAPAVFTVCWCLAESHDTSDFLFLGGQDHRAERGLVLWTPIPGYKGFLHMAQAQQEGEILSRFFASLTQDLYLQNRNL